VKTAITGNQEQPSSRPPTTDPSFSSQLVAVSPGTALTSFESILNDMKLYACNMPSSPLHRSQSDLISNSYINLINETIASVVKIKKRNKASYFHLALVPFNYYTPGSVPLGMSGEAEARTMPWLLHNHDIAKTSVGSWNSCSSSAEEVEFEDDQEEEEEEEETAGGVDYDSEKIAESDESATATPPTAPRPPRFDRGCQR
jgi:hypothetical protein